jgi:hypothetical protein
MDKKHGLFFYRKNLIFMPKMYIIEAYTSPREKGAGGVMGVFSRPS